jgi:hypothetical protein
MEDFVAAAATHLPEEVWSSLDTTAAASIDGSQLHSAAHVCHAALRCETSCRGKSYWE